MYRKIEYGEFTTHLWNGIIGINDPLFKKWLERIQPYLDGYELWIYGGVLEDWLTYDIDASLIGPLDPNKINHILREIVRVSFEFGLYPDIKYAFDGQLFRWSDWIASGETHQIKYAYYQPKMWVNDKLIEWGRLQNGLWVNERAWPMQKAIYSNHHYKDPIRIA
jgi:hypothetical protein